jgi:hypothetical protein
MNRLENGLVFLQLDHNMMNIDEFIFGGAAGECLMSEYLLESVVVLNELRQCTLNKRVVG